METIEEYMRERESKEWSVADTEHVMEHIRQVEATWQQVTQHHAGEIRAGYFCIDDNGRLVPRAHPCEICESNPCQCEGL